MVFWSLMGKVSFPPGRSSTRADDAVNKGEGAVKRTLEQRHMAMIALGGAIGTGLFVSSGSALATGGPVGVWLGYIFMSTMTYSM
jgi:amino acid transporter